MQHNVLVIEENEWLVRMYEAIFQSMDCTITRAPTIRDVQRVSPTMEPPDLVIVNDPGLGGGWLGSTAEIRAWLGNADTPVIVTVSELPLHDSALPQDGCSSIVTKPLDVGAFSALARRYIGSSLPRHAPA